MINQSVHINQKLNYHTLGKLNKFQSFPKVQFIHFLQVVWHCAGIAFFNLMVLNRLVNQCQTLSTMSIECISLDLIVLFADIKLFIDVLSWIMRKYCQLFENRSCILEVITRIKIYLRFIITKIIRPWEINDINLKNVVDQRS